jgi:hypothetical protein
MECVEAAVGPASGPAGGVDWPVAAEDLPAAGVAWPVGVGDSANRGWVNGWVVAVLPAAGVAVALLANGVDSAANSWDVRERWAAEEWAGAVSGQADRCAAARGFGDRVWAGRARAGRDSARAVAAAYAGSAWRGDDRSSITGRDALPGRLGRAGSAAIRGFPADTTSGGD